ncbi:hypothetical protein EVAR_84868_1 [Eumeta japonica]|uniref:Uncharacterized protein n=1 Tax=Eumeta variegata TaxID=151549 RepID=A0A4C1Z7L8_EUMVA|nr:hypothetical protein EVAR_84868_1 [Eumeta japonica]
MATFQLHHQTLLPYSIKVLVKTNQTSPNSMGLRRLITEFLWPPSLAHQTGYHIVSKYSVERIKRAQTRWVASFNCSWPPSSSIIRPWLPYSIKVLVKRNQTSPNSMGLRRLITEFLWPPSSSIIRPWLSYI